MVFEYTSYRKYLRSVLTERTAGNSRYSLRAMARQFGYTPSMVSAVINGKANFSVAALRTIAGKLRLDARQAEYLCLLAELDSAGDPVAREPILARMRTVRPNVFATYQLEVEQFEEIADWYHSAILEYCRLRHARRTVVSIAKALGISIVEAQKALDRLVRLGFLKALPSGHYRRVGPRVAIQSVGRNRGMIHFYRQMLSKIDQALDTQSPQERLSGYETFPLAPEGLPELRAAFLRFLEETQKISSKYVNHKHVYHAAVHILNLTPQRDQA